MTKGKTLQPLRRGFTLVESLMAAGILLIIVTAVTMAVSAGQQHAFWAQQRISGTLAAEELLIRLQATEYSDLPGWHNRTQEVGEMLDAKNNPLPSSFSGIGRTVTVTETVMVNPAALVEIHGRTITVRTFDAENRTLARLRRFVPHPTLALVGEVAE